MEQNYLITLYKITKNIVEENYENIKECPNIIEQKQFKKLHLKMKKWLTKSNKIKINDLDEINELFCYLYEVIYKKYFDYEINDYFLNISLLFKSMDAKTLETFWKLWIDMYSLQWLWYQVYSNNIVYSDIELKELNESILISIKKSLYSCLVNLIFIYQEQSEVTFAKKIEDLVENIKHENSINIIAKKIKLKTKDNLKYNIIDIIKHNDNESLNIYFLNEIINHYYYIIKSIHQ